MPKKLGRPKVPKARQRVTIVARVKPETKAKLKAAAAANRQSLGRHLDDLADLADGEPRPLLYE